MNKQQTQPQMPPQQAVQQRPANMMPNNYPGDPNRTPLMMKAMPPFMSPTIMMQPPPQMK